MALIALALGTGCKKKDAEVVDVESSSSTATEPTKPAVEAPPTANEKPDTKADDTKSDDTKSDDSKDDSKSDTGAKADSKGSSGPAWMTKASEQFATAFGKRDKSGVYAWAKDRKEIQIKLERYSGDKVQSKKEQISDMKVFTECLTGGPKTKCPVKELPVQFSKAGKVTSCDDECCEFEFNKSDLKAKTIFLTKACFKAPEGKERPGLKAIKIMHGG